MRKAKAKMRRMLKKVFISGVLMAMLVIYYLAPQLPTHFYYWLASPVVLAFVCWLIFKFERKPDKYINARGYVVLAQYNELEHRYIAKQMLGRELASNEIVHHINGNKTDNRVWNLCLMDGEKHEHFHAWLKWKKEKNRKYPAFSDQKRVLVDEYKGILLQSLPESEEALKLELQNRLFHALRKERKRLADEKKVPAYEVFYDKTLVEMSEIMPVTEPLMLQIKGVGPAKFRMFGLRLIEVIIRFKKEFNLV